VFSIAKETGWTEDVIINMPLGRLWSYRHALLRAYDVETHHITDEDDRREIHELFMTL
jgi:hypothetical protein